RPGISRYCRDGPTASVARPVHSRAHGPPQRQLQYPQPHGGIAARRRSRESGPGPMKPDKARGQERGVMIEDELEYLHEHYGAAVRTLVTGQGVLRERLREALGWLERSRPLCGWRPKDDFHRRATEDLPGFLEAAGRLETLTEQELEELAERVWIVLHKLDDAFLKEALAEEAFMLGLADEESTPTDTGAVTAGPPPGPEPDAVTFPPHSPRSDCS